MTPDVPRELVLASAGSGKTYLITSRLIGLLAMGEETDRILAATFTRKAAGEILDRVLLRLARAALTPSEAVRLSSDALGRQPEGDPVVFWEGILRTSVVRRLHRFNVGTLDSFFVRAASAMGLELGLPVGWRIVDVTEGRDLRARTLDDVLENIQQPELVEMLRLAARGSLRRSVHEHFAGMMEQLLEIRERIDPSGPDPWLTLTRAMRPSTQGADPEELANLLQVLPLPRTNAGAPRRQWAQAIPQAVESLRAGDWDRLMSITLCQRVATGNLTFDGAPIEGQTLELFEQIVESARREMEVRLAAQAEALGSLSARFHHGYRALQRAEGRYSFTDITRLIAEGGGSIEDLYYRLDSSTQHLLLDEFQDTSRVQWEALQPIAEEVLSQEGRAAVIVADPKQSIYGWRGAEPAIVHAVGDRYALPVSTLTVSRRSSPIVLDLVNVVFGGIARNTVLADGATCQDVAESWARDFSTHSAYHDLPGHVTIDVGPRAQRGRAQAQLICRYAAERVAALRESHPRFSIGILTRTNAVVARIYLELRRLGVDVSQEGGTPLTDSAACEALLALLRVADHPGDTVARYHVASSPLGVLVGLLDHEARHQAEAIARRLRAKLVNDGYGSTITRLARDLVPHCDRREARRLAQLAEIAHRYDLRATLRPMDFVRLVESERVEDPASARVRVMTVHQAKGLEFDIVVLPQLDDPIFGGGRPPAAIPFRSPETGELTAVYPSTRKEIRCLFPEIEAAEQQRRAAVLRDGLSTLYVALTRAKYALHAIIRPDGDSGPGNALTPARILREAIVLAGAAPTAAAPRTTIHEGGDADWALRPGASPEYAAETNDQAVTTVVFPSMSRVRRPRNLRRESPSELARGLVSAREILRLEGSEAKEEGKIVHAWFETIRWLEDEPPTDASLLEIAKHLSPLPESRARELLRDFRAWLAHPPIGTAMSRARYTAGVASVERELPFLRRYGDAVMEGVIDRLVLVREGTRIVEAEIIDFKTDKEPTSEPRRAALIEHYRPQLAAYVDAVAEMYEIPRARCRATLVLLKGGRVVPVC